MFKRTRISSGVLVALGGDCWCPRHRSSRRKRSASRSRARASAAFDAETASPVQTITREEIAKSGKSSVAEYLQNLTADNQGSVPMSFGSGFAPARSGISLRGLGAHATLVLINGRRVRAVRLADDGQNSWST